MSEEFIRELFDRVILPGFKVESILPELNTEQLDKVNTLIYESFIRGAGFSKEYLDSIKFKSLGLN